MISVQRHEVCVCHGVVRHARDDPNTQSKAHVGFNHIRIGGGENDLGFEPCRVECLIELRAAGEAKHIRYDSKSRHILQCEALDFHQGVVLGD